MQTFEDIIVRLDSPELPCEDVQIYKLTGRETISQLFWFEIEFAYLKPAQGSADDPASAVNAEPLDPKVLLGSEVSLVFERNKTEIRRVYGMIAQVDDMLDSQTPFTTYRARIVPRHHRLTLVQTQDVFMDMTVPEIIQKKLELVGLDADMELRLLGQYPKREFVVQYKETDLAFISRLAEHLGISFFFEHASGSEKMIFTDHKNGYQPAEYSEKVVFRPRGDKTDVYRLQATTSLVPSDYVVQDYNYRTPRIDLTGQYQLSTGYGGGVVEYGSHHKTPDEGKQIAQIRAEERQALGQYYTATSDIRQICAGATVKLEEHPRLDSLEMLIVDVEHSATQAVMTMGSEGQGNVYTNVFRATDATLTYRPPRVTPKPRIHGVITGVIEPLPGAKMGEIGNFAQLDDHGRYTIKFFFDSGEPAQMGRSSRPVRMATPHAGQYYGVHFPLKPGVEVVVAFVDGDPDRPIITNAVPNPVTLSPVRGPNAVLNRIKTVSGILIEMKDVVSAGSGGGGGTSGKSTDPLESDANALQTAIARET